MTPQPADQQTRLIAQPYHRSPYYRHDGLSGMSSEQPERTPKVMSLHLTATPTQPLAHLVAAGMAGRPCAGEEIAAVYSRQHCSAHAPIQPLPLPLSLCFLTWWR